MNIPNILAEKIITKSASDFVEEYISCDNQSELIEDVILILRYCYRVDSYNNLPTYVKKIYDGWYSENYRYLNSASEKTVYEELVEKIKLLLTRKLYL